MKPLFFPTSLPPTFMFIFDSLVSLTRIHGLGMEGVMYKSLGNLLLTTTLREMTSPLPTHLLSAVAWEGVGPHESPCAVEC